MEQNFSLGITYWPRQKKQPFSWHTVDWGATRHDLEHIADIGCNTVCLRLQWEEFQPGIARIDGGAMRALERMLDLVQSSGCRAVVTLLNGSLAGTLHLPAWATGFTLDLEPAPARRFGPPLLIEPPVRSELLYEGRYHHTPVRDLYRDPKQIAAQRYLLNEVTGYFADHPVLWAWQFGEDLDRARPPVSNDAALEWFGRLTEHARTLHTRHLAGSITPRTLARRDTLRPEQLGGLCDSLVLSMRHYEPLPIERPWQSDAVAFLHALTATLGGKPVVVSELGLATHPANENNWFSEVVFGRRVRRYLVDEERQATFIEETLERLYREGAAGVWLAGYADIAEELWDMPPLDRSISARTLGVVHADRREKRVCMALRAFAARLRQGSLPAQGRPPTIAVDPEYYWRTPARELRRLFEGT